MQPEFGVIGRTWWFAVLLLGVTTAMLWFGKLSEETWMIANGLSSFTAAVTKSVEKIKAANTGNSMPPGPP